MTNSLQELYKQTLLKHSKNAEHQREIANPTYRSTVRNRLCGDEISVSVNVDDNTITELAYRSQCCSICAASASMLAQLSSNCSVESLGETARTLIDSLNGKAPQELMPAEGDLEALNGVRSFPSRIRCATLPWEAFLNAVQK